jgi:HEAT repeat protein
MSQLREQLSAIEPDEHTYEGIGSSEVDLLTELLDDEEPWLAARAVHALGRINDDAAGHAVLTAASKPRLEVRVAAATTAPVLSPQLSDEILSKLLADPEGAVRKFAIKSVSSRNGEPIRRRLRELTAKDPNQRLRRAADDKSRSL